jgi:hypothetical protein
MAIVIPFFAGALLAVHFGLSFLGVISFLVGTAAMFAIHAFLVPLGKRDI